jgi:two-component system CheB/CheR fusion protein
VAWTNGGAILMRLHRATGEEAYSVAITLFEAAGDKASQLNVQIFGTDVSEPAVEVARQGVYPERIGDDVPPDKLRRFFTRADGVCRNVLICCDATISAPLIRLQP